MSSVRLKVVGAEQSRAKDIRISHYQYFLYFHYYYYLPLCWIKDLSSSSLSPRTLS